MAKLAKRAIPALKKEGYIQMGLFHGPEKLARDLVQGLEYCYLANMLGSIFLHQPITYPLFFPEASVKRQPGKDLGTSATKNKRLEKVLKKKGKRVPLLILQLWLCPYVAYVVHIAGVSWIQTLLAGLVRLVHLYTLRYLRVSYLKIYLTYRSCSRVLSVLVGLLR